MAYVLVVYVIAFYLRDFSFIFLFYSDFSVSLLRSFELKSDAKGWCRMKKTQLSALRKMQKNNTYII